jgi:hypothetical protein
MSTASNSSESVRVLRTSGEVPVMVHGQLCSQSDQTVVVEATGTAGGLSAGDRVVLSFGTPDQGRISGTIQSITDVDGGQQIQVSCAAAHDRDKRDFPRLCAGLPIRYRVASAEDGQAWVAGSPAPTQGWFTPDPFMNFSVSGLRFDADRSVQADDLLALDFAIADGSPRWRITARVIRVFTPESEDSPTHSVAVSFAHLPEGANTALSELTLKIQDNLL